MSVRPLVSSPTDEGLLVTCWTNHQRNTVKPPSREVYYSERKKTKKRPPNIRIMTSPRNDSRWKDDPNRSEVKSPNWEYHDENNETKAKKANEKPREEKSSCLVIMCCPWEKKKVEKRRVEKEVEINIEKRSESGTYKNYKDDDMQWVDGAKQENNKGQKTAVKNGGVEVKREESLESSEVTHTRMIEEHSVQRSGGSEAEVKQRYDQSQTEVKLMNDLNTVNSEYSEIHTTKQTLGFNNNHNANGSVVHQSNMQSQTNGVAVTPTDDSMDLDGLLNLLEEQTEGLEKSRTTLRRKSKKSEGGMSSGLAKSAGSLYTIDEQYDNQPTTYESNDEVFQGESPLLHGGEDIYVDSARIRETKMEQKRMELSKESSPELDDEFFDVPRFPLHLQSTSGGSTLARYSMQPHQQSNRFHTYHHSDGQASRVKPVPTQFQSNPLYVYDKQYRGYHSTQTLNMGGQEYEELPDRASINSSMQHILDTDSVRSRHNSMSFGTQTGNEEGAVVVQHDLLSWGKDIDTQSVIDVSANKKHSLQLNTRLQPPESRSRSTSPQTATSFYRAGFGVLDQSSSIHNRKVNVSLKNRTRCCLAEVDFTPDDNTHLVSKVGRVVEHKMQGTMQLTQDTVWDTIRYVAVYELQGMRTQLRDSWFLYSEFSWEGKMCEPMVTMGFFNAYYDQMHAAKTGETGHHLFRKIKMGSQRIKVSCKIKRGLAHADIELMVRQD